MDTQKVWRQGELAFIKVNVNEDQKPILMKYLSKKENNVIREGEMTGHKHMASDTATLYNTTTPNSIGWWNNGSMVKLPAGQMFLTSDNQIEIRHDEHKTLNLPAGDYMVRVQREYDETKDRLIAD